METVMPVTVAPATLVARAEGCREPLALVAAAEPELRAAGHAPTGVWWSTPGGVGMDGRPLRWDAAASAWREDRGGPAYATVADYLRTWWRPYESARQVLECITGHQVALEPLDAVFGRGR